MSIVGHCVLDKGHANFPEQCALRHDASSAQCEEEVTQLDINLGDPAPWKPGRDMPGGDIPICAPATDGLLPENLIEDDG